MLDTSVATHPWHLLVLEELRDIGLIELNDQVVHCSHKLEFGERILAIFPADELNETVQRIVSVRLLNHVACDHGFQLIEGDFKGLGGHRRFAEQFFKGFTSVTSCELWSLKQVIDELRCRWNQF